MVTTMDHTTTFYSSPSYRFHGAGMPVFSGSRRQRGGSILGSLKSLITPVLGKVGQVAKKQAFGLAGDMIGDVFAGRNLQQSLKTRGLNRLKNVGKETLSSLMSGSSTSRKRKAQPKARIRRTRKRRRTAANF